MQHETFNETQDIALRDLDESQSTLDWVGMDGVSQLFKLQDGAKVYDILSQVQVYVDLVDTFAKGVHMSRLYVTLDKEMRAGILSPLVVSQSLEELLATQKDLSSRAFVAFRFDHYLRRCALVTDYAGWNNYPVVVRGLLNGTPSVDMECSINYSSTCPCSAALARQLIQEQFNEDFGTSGFVDARDVKEWLGTEKGIVATPHGQRSIAKIRVRIPHDMISFPLTQLIDDVERTLETPAQTAVKREDEQEFARLNAQNPMFCEDAGRKLKSGLEAKPWIEDFVIRVEHLESLHAHNAVCVVAKNIQGGYRATP